MRKVRWGVLSTAKIGTKKVIPGMARCELAEVTAIASRSLEAARSAASELGIDRAYGSYEELLADPEIDVIYNPLPNHLHVPWSIRAAAAGKHVLCEKPISVTVSEVRDLIAARDRYRVKIGEAFMVRTHPQWLRTRELIRSGTVGDLRSIVSVFSYFNADPANIRNIPDYGGGGVMDIGCYPITMSRFLFEQEPLRVSALIERDPDMGTDRLSSAMLDFGSGQAVFTCSTQLVSYQTMQVLGTRGRIELEIPYNIPPDRPSRIFIDDGKELGGRSAVTEEFATTDQYRLQGDEFSRAVLDGGEPPVPLEDALKNMAVITAVLRSGKTGSWEKPDVA